MSLVSCFEDVKYFVSFSVFVSNQNEQKQIKTNKISKTKIKFACSVCFEILRLTLWFCLVEFEFDRFLSKYLPLHTVFNEFHAHPFFTYSILNGFLFFVSNNFSMQNSIVSYFMHLRRTNIVQTRGFQFEKHFILVYIFFPVRFSCILFLFRYTQKWREEKNDDGVDFVDSVYAYTRAFQIRLEPTRCCYSYIYFSLLFVPLCVFILDGLHVLCVSCYVSATAIQKACIKRKQEERNNPWFVYIVQN